MPLWAKITSIRKAGAETQKLVICSLIAAPNGSILSTLTARGIGTLECLLIFNAFISLITLGRLICALKVVRKPQRGPVTPLVSQGSLCRVGIWRRGIKWVLGHCLSLLEAGCAHLHFCLHWTLRVTILTVHRNPRWERLAGARMRSVTSTFSFSPCSKCSWLQQSCPLSGYLWEFCGCAGSGFHMAADRNEQSQEQRWLFFLSFLGAPNNLYSSICSLLAPLPSPKQQGSSHHQSVPNSGSCPSWGMCTPFGIASFLLKRLFMAAS